MNRKSLDDDVDPVEEIRAIRDEIARKFKTPSAYLAYLRTRSIALDEDAGYNKKEENKKNAYSRKPASKVRRRIAVEH